MDQKKLLIGGAVALGVAAVAGLGYFLYAHFHCAVSESFTTMRRKSLRRSPRRPLLPPLPLARLKTHK